MNGWYQIKDKRDGTEVTINLDNVDAIGNFQGYAAFIMNNPRFNVIYSSEKYSDVIRNLFGPEEGEDDGRPREDPSGFNGVLPM